MKYSLELTVNMEAVERLCREWDIPVPKIKIYDYAANDPRRNGDTSITPDKYTRGIFYLAGVVGHIELYQRVNDFLLKCNTRPRKFLYWTAMWDFHRDLWIETLLHELRHHWQYQKWPRRFIALDKASRTYENRLIEKDANKFAKMNIKKYRYGKNKLVSVRLKKVAA